MSHPPSQDSMHRRGRRRALGAIGLAPLAILSGRLSGAVQAGTSTNVRDHGATGDGRTDDTKAIQAAIDAVKDSGGTVAVPSGTYMIDATTSVHLRSGLRLMMEQGAILQALPTDSAHYAVLSGRDCADVQVVGGRVIGERIAHRGRGGEWGMGILLEGCKRVVLQNVLVERCWGDGIYLGASTPITQPGAECEDIRLLGVSSLANRRQGLSIVACVGALISKCIFAQTNGTAPEAGVDLEPEGSKRVTKILIEDCEMLSNQGFGLAILTEMSSAITVRGNRVHDNVRGGIHLGFGTHQVRVLENILQSNPRGDMLLMQGAHDNIISHNRFLTANSKAAHITIVQKSAGNVIKDNQFADNPQSDYDIDVQADAGFQQIGKNSRAEGVGGLALRLRQHQ